MKIGKKNKKEQQNAAALSKEESAVQDLTKLKKKDLLEIMLKQGEEIDSLRAQVAELQERLDNRIFELNQVGNLAEASLVVTNVFEEAQKAAVIYLNNVKKFANEHYGVSRRGAYDDE